MVMLKGFVRKRRGTDTILIKEGTKPTGKNVIVIRRLPKVDLKKLKIVGSIFVVRMGLRQKPRQFNSMKKAIEFIKSKI